MKHKIFNKDYLGQSLVIQKLIDKDFNRWTLVFHRYKETWIFQIKQLLDKDMVIETYIIQTLEDLDHKLLIKELMNKDFNKLIIKELMDKDFNRWTLVIQI